MDKIKFKLDDNGEPACDPENCPQWCKGLPSARYPEDPAIVGRKVPRCAKLPNQGHYYPYVNDPCIPGLRQQRDEARGEAKTARGGRKICVYKYTHEADIGTPNFNTDCGWGAGKHGDFCHFCGGLIRIDRLEREGDDG